MRLHVEALFTCDTAGHLVAVNDAGRAAAPRFFLGRTGEGSAWWFRHDLDAALTSDLDALCTRDPHAADPFIDRLARAAPVRKTWTGPAFCFPVNLLPANDGMRVTADNAGVLSPYLDDWQGDVAEGVPMVVVVEDGKAVSICASVRVTENAHEAGVETHRAFRGRGHAARAVAGWARDVRALGRIPLYSTSWENTASQAVARKLGLRQFGVDLHIT